jgi:hypothetical protein
MSKTLSSARPVWPADQPAAHLSAPLRLLKRLTAGLRRHDAPRDSGDNTTLPSPGRGQALREAHRTLHARLHSHPALIQLLPHLACIERKLAKRGTRALQRLPVPVLQRGLEQLALLQHEDERPADAVNLRVLRLRLIESIAVRTAQDAMGAGPSTPVATETRHTASRSTLPPRSWGVEVSEVSASTFSDAAIDWARDEPAVFDRQTAKH